MTEAAPGGVHHVAIAVRDLGALERFYTAVIGLPLLRRWPATPVTNGALQDRAVWLDLGAGGFLALERADEPDGGATRELSAGRPAGYLMIALRIARAARADWEARLAAAGVPVVHRTAYTLYVTDPEGNRLGLSHWPEAAEPDAGGALARPERRG